MNFLKLKNVEETTGLNLKNSGNYSILSDLILSIIPTYVQWSYDYSEEILIIQIEEGVIVDDVSAIGEVVIENDNT